MGFVFGSSLLRQWTSFPDQTGGPDPIGNPRDTAIICAVAGGLALLSGRVARPVWAFVVMLGSWVALEAVSGWALTGAWDTRPLLLSTTCAGLALGAAVVPPSLSGWTVFGFGCVYTWLNILLWRDETIVWQAGFGGLAVNGNMTGNFAAFFVVFAAPFALGRWHRHYRSHRGLVITGRVSLIGISAFPGLFVLDATSARSAMAAVVFGWGLALMGMAWTRNRAVATIGAIALPVLMLLPVALSYLLGWRLSGRDCVWASWRLAMTDTPLWGLGPPGSFPAETCGFPRWGHAHNEVLQSWSVSGLLGLITFVALLVLLGWYAVRHSDRDGRALLATLGCAGVLLSMELMTSFGFDWVGLGLAGFIVIGARSLSLMAGPGPGTAGTYGSTGADPRVQYRVD